MSSYVNVIFIGILFFILLFWFVLLYTLLRSYHKYGQLNPLKSFMFMAFVLYIEIAYFLTILPLPDASSMNQAIQPLRSYMQLNIFYFITDSISYFQEHGFSLISPPIYTTVFNILLLVPLGIFLRKLFNYKMNQIIVIALLVSLSFELIQLSGLFFIYPYPYRLFDINDIMFNTLGAFLGAILATKISIFDKILEQKNNIFYVTKAKQFVIFISDLTIIFIFYIVSSILANIASIAHNQQVDSIIRDERFNLIFTIFTLFFLFYPLLKSNYQTLANRLSNTYLDNKHNSLLLRLARTCLFYLPFILSQYGIASDYFNLITFIYLVYFVIHIFTKKVGMNPIDKILDFHLKAKSFKTQ
jgi:glycopeptide antibiotics resistance protein